MNQIILAFTVGAIVGGVFSFFKLPLPAPPTIAGIMGILGLFCGYMIISHFIK